jgi:hypothetical protein
MLMIAIGFSPQPSDLGHYLGRKGASGGLLVCPWGANSGGSSGHLSVTL